ncbi:inter-alpha-trypsin inhibitor heavy chain H2 isoform X1 [Mauremys reevesii]|uniref:inter-alpha-trypsin inhibitor heavy chain H2 isoform X1 n=1 Tax=Mauremys reevesii TaxID=260615 RepID=UPI00193F3606|nr:inter-alpha-trypsin inhibitor heavy chain H2 isoform X1 [Mauremys reevesii]
MKQLICILLLFLVSEIRSFDLVIDEIPDDLENLFDLEVDGFLSKPMMRNGRYQRSTLNDEDSGESVAGDDKISIYSYKVQSTITSRLVDTMIQSKVENKAKHAQNLVFDVQIPKGAFIHNFTMNINGITFTSSIREKSAARQQYAQARAKGKAAGIVRSSALDMENFKAELNVPGGMKVQFEIHYQEMMRRKLGSYEYVIPLQPGRLAKHLEVDVRIIEPQGLRYVHVPNSLGDHFAGITTISKGEKKAHVSFKPTVAQQRKCPTCSATAVDGNFVVTYDVHRETKAGELEIFNGYFIHYFAPDNLDPLPKNILFVIDVSGSMWGLKMKQTVEAMKTILGDLRPDDHFSVVDFNHNVRTWRDDLVAATASQKEDAKKYIQEIHPNGGTNINEALLRAIFILKEASNLGMLDPNSVSMIVLVSDGDPTVGELKLTKIQKNVKQNIPKDVSLFSLGIGFDVDYDFLDRLAHENHGMAQRIFGNQETSSQMKKFYNQVSTPLLKKVEFNYPQGSVSDVTQNSFDNYFGGSEIVVAGKVDADNVQHLQSIITATSSNAELVLETLTDVEGLDDFLKKEPHADPKFTEKLWAYLTINQLLAERNLAPTAALKRNLTRSILQMSLDHHIVTPFTAMLIENPERNERMLADSPQDQKRGCCPGTLSVVSNGLDKSIPPWAKSLPTTRPTLALEGPRITSVDNDPHFIIHLLKIQENICFNIDSEPGNILNLVSDPDSGIVVNGQLTGAKKRENTKLSTYFGKIGFYFKNKGLKVEISTEMITLKDGSYSTALSWSDTGSIIRKRLLVSVKKDRSVTITVDTEMSFMVLLHRVWKNHPVNVDFLGIYIPPTNRFSPSAHGLIGQFMSEPEVHIFNERPSQDPEKPEATMEVKGHKLTVTSGLQKDYRTDQLFGTNVHCWFVHNSGKGFIDGHYNDYLVPHLYSFLKNP